MSNSWNTRQIPEPWMTPVEVMDAKQVSHPGTYSIIATQ